MKLIAPKANKKLIKSNKLKWERRKKTKKNTTRTKRNSEEGRKKNSNI